MITDADIKKMKAVFVTKDDIKKMKAVFATKEDVQKSTSELVELITIGFERMDKAIERLSDHDEIIESHERRLDKIEDKIFA